MIKQEVERIINMKIPENGWDEVFKRKQTLGDLDMKTMINIILVVCKTLEKLENNAE